jgi:hypothetical protein
MLRRVGELDAIVGQQRVDLVGYGLDQRGQEAGGTSQEGQEEAPVQNWRARTCAPDIVGDGGQRSAAAIGRDAETTRPIYRSPVRQRGVNG